MPILMAVLWGIATSVMMFAVHKYWVPRLVNIAGETAEHHSEKQNVSAPGQELPRVLFRGFSAIWIICGLFAFICGFRVAIFADSGWSIFRLWLVFSVFSCVAVTDYELMLIPNKCSLVLLLGGLICLVGEWIGSGAFPVAEMVACLLSAGIILVVMLIMVFVTKGGFGMGDVKIISSFAFVCGLSAACYVVTAALLFCALISSLLLLTKKKQIKDLLPLGPFLWLSLGVMIVLRFI